MLFDDKLGNKIFCCHRCLQGCGNQGFCMV